MALIITLLVDGRTHMLAQFSLHVLIVFLRKVLDHGRRGLGIDTCRSCLPAINILNGKVIALGTEDTTTAHLLFYPLELLLTDQEVA